MKKIAVKNIKILMLSMFTLGSLCSHHQGGFGLLHAFDPLFGGGGKLP